MVPRMWHSIWYCCRLWSRPTESPCPGGLDRIIVEVTANLAAPACTVVSELQQAAGPEQWAPDP